MNTTQDTTTGVLGSSEALVAGMSRMRWRTFFLRNALGGATWATATSPVGYSLGETLDVVERSMGRVGVLLVALLTSAFALRGSYEKVAHLESLSRVAERLGSERERGKKGARRLVQSAVVAVLVVSLACAIALVYFGEWPQVWDFLEISGSSLELLAER